MENLHWGSLLHDVGKIGIPDAVLCKPGRLTSDEYTFIKVHPERSYEILRHVDRLKGAIEGARHHQEKFDGTGYPHGLRGTSIPCWRASSPWPTPTTASPAPAPTGPAAPMRPPSRK
jgi:response regulator RpfG family c-di-GMP phosphodiesterase